MSLFAPPSTSVGLLEQERRAPADAKAEGGALWALILAGGIGSRFWPLSSSKRPKQVLALLSDQPLLREAVLRLAPLVPPERILIATSRDIAPAITGAVPEVPSTNLLIEPEPLGTAASVAWGVETVFRRAGAEALVCAIHADLAVAFPEAFRRVLITASGVAARHDLLVTIGIQPTRPDTSFGYVLPGLPLDAVRSLGAGGGASASSANPPGAPVEGGAYSANPSGAPDEGGAYSANPPGAPDEGSAYSANPPGAPDEGSTYRAKPPGALDEGGAYSAALFIEKPARPRAEELIRSGALWNAGVCVFRCGVAQQAIATHATELANGLNALRSDRIDLFADAIQSIAFERAVLERSDQVAVVPGDFGWDDVGTWAALRRARELDDDGNGIVGRAHCLDSSGNIVHAADSAVVLYGVDGLLVVSVNGITFVTTLARATDLRPLIDSLPEWGQGAGENAGR